MPTDAVEAVRWARVAAEAGLVQGYAMLGDRLSALDHDEEALAWYVKGAEAGDLGCALSAACWYRDGYGTQVDRVQSLRWFLTLFWTERMGDALHAAHEVAEQMSEADVYRAGSLAGQPLAAVNLCGIRQTRQAR